MLKKQVFLLFRCKTTNSPISAVPFQEKSSFHFVVLWKLLNEMEWLKLIIAVKYIRIILSLNWMDLVVFLYLYGGFDAWPINTEFVGDDRAIFRVDVFRSLAFSLQDLKHAVICWQNVEESCTFQKIYGLGKVKLKIKWPVRLEKTQI